jgi:UDP-N-acetylglucosamine 2-epimerase
VKIGFASWFRTGGNAAAVYEHTCSLVSPTERDRHLTHRWTEAPLLKQEELTERKCDILVCDANMQGYAVQIIANKTYRFSYPMDDGQCFVSCDLEKDRLLDVEKVSADQIVVTGSPNTDVLHATDDEKEMLRRMFLRSCGLDYQKRTIRMFLRSCGLDYQKRTITFAYEKFFSTDISVFDELLEVVKQKDMNLIVRKPFRDIHESLRKKIDEIDENDHVAVSVIEDFTDSVPLLLATDVFVTTSSPLAVGFLALDRPIILMESATDEESGDIVHRRDTFWWYNTIRSASAVVSSAGEMRNELLHTPRENREKAMRSIVQFTDGCNTERVLAHVMEGGT